MMLRTQIRCGSFYRLWEWETERWRRKTLMTSMQFNSMIFACRFKSIWENFCFCILNQFAISACQMNKAMWKQQFLGDKFMIRIQHDHLTFFYLRKVNVPCKFSYLSLPTYFFNFTQKPIEPRKSRKLLSRDVNLLQTN